MSGQFAVPALPGVDDVPSTLAGEVMSQLLRSELGFEGVTITDALDTKALDQGPKQVLDVLAALRAGVVQDEGRNVPLRLGPEERILAVMPRPVDLTPADTSSTVPPGLATALRTVHPRVDENPVGHGP